MIVGKFTVSLIGSSRDLRTNKWSVKCACGKRHEPDTTMLAKQRIVCPKCEYTAIINYNEYTL